MLHFNSYANDLMCNLGRNNW